MARLENIKQILVINLGGIGDLLLSTPALRALKEAYPEARMTLLVVARAYDAVKGLSYVDEVTVFYKEPLRILKDIGLLVYLRKRHFDIAVNMRTLVSKASAGKMNLLLEMIRPRIKAGRDTDGMGSFFDIKIPETRIGQKSEMEYDIDTVNALGAEVIDKTTDLPITDADSNKAGRLLEGLGIKPQDRLIGIHPGGRLSHRWPLANFEKLIEELRRKKQCKFIITGDSDEKGLAMELARSGGDGVIELAGELNINELGALIKRCDVFISNDTAPMHIAASLKVPVVAIFGPGDVKRFDPRNISEKAEALYKTTPCAPCEKRRCDDMRCLKGISVDNVVERALKWIR